MISSIEIYQSKDPSFRILTCVCAFSISVSVSSIFLDIFGNTHTDIHTIFLYNVDVKVDPAYTARKKNYINDKRLSITEEFSPRHQLSLK